MLTPATAFPILADVIRNARRHADYKHVNDLRVLYYQLITGDGAETLLRQFVRREDAEAFAQRVSITQLVVIAWSGMIMQQFYRPGRLKNIKRTIGYNVEAAQAAAKTAEIEDRVKNYWGRESLETWLATRFVSLTFQDPNAFIVTEFKSFNPVTGKAQPYPVEYGSDEAIMYSYTNNILDYLIVKQTVSSVSPSGKVVNVDRYTMYLDNDVVVAQQVPEPVAGNIASNFNAQAPNDALPTNGIWNQDDKSQFAVTTYQPRGGKVQAIRVGYLFDDQTKGRTYVNPMHRAVPFFKKSIHETSEMDLSIALHAHPQKLFYAQPCPGMPRQPCLSGITASNNADGSAARCQRCLGSGVVVHKSAQDALAVPMPAPGSPAPAIPLKDMVAYVTPDVTLLEFMDKHLRSLRQDAIDAVFNNGLSGSAATAGAGTGEGVPSRRTATEIVVNSDRADNTLAPFADQRTAVWRYTVELIAEFLDNGGPDLQLVFEHPSSFNIKTYDQLLGERKEAAGAGAPHYVIQELDRQLAEMLFSTDGATLAKIKAKNYFTPFLGKSSDEIIFLFSSELARTEDKILWGYGDSIFDELGEEVPTFYSLTRAKQWELIKPKIDKIISELPQPVTALALPAAP